MSERALDDLMAFSDDEATDEALRNRKNARRNDNGLGEDEEHVDLAEWDAGEDNDEIPPRGWLLGTLLCRQFLTLVIGDGGVGKTALLITMALSLATGRKLIREHVFVRGRVMLLCFEDGITELRRRLAAAMIHHRISKDEVRGFLFLATVQRPDAKLVAAIPGRELAEGKLGGAIEAAILRRALDAVLIDPFVKAHGGPENDNTAMDMSAGILARIAIERDIALCALHHTRKGPPDPGNADMGRGGGSLKDAGRLAYTLTPMQKEEGDRYCVSEEERASLIRLDHGKVNLVRRDPNARWFQFISVPIGNRTEIYPNGDAVQTVARWDSPDLFTGAADAVWNQILDDLDRGMENGQRYSAAGAARDRAAWRVVVKHVERTEKQARAIIKSWLKTGLLIEDDYEDEADRRTRKGLRVDATKRPGPR